MSVDPRSNKGPFKLAAVQTLRASIDLETMTDVVHAGLVALAAVRAVHGVGRDMLFGPP